MGDDRDLTAADPARPPHGGLIGRAEPRIWTRPLRDLSEPGATLGLDFIEFCEQFLCWTPMPWQRWLAMHALELRADGQFRFDTVVVLVGRQCGKTTFVAALALFNLIWLERRLCAGSAQDLGTAREPLERAFEMLEEHYPDVLPPTRNRGLFTNNNDTKLELCGRGKWRVRAAAKNAGRGLSVDGVLLLDELRHMRTAQDGWASLSKTTNAYRGRAQRWAISNAGDDQSGVLNHLQDRGRANATDPQYAGSSALFEWSAPDECELTDLQAYTYSLPALGHTMDAGVILSSLDDDPPEVTRIEMLCQRVPAVNSAVREAAWLAARDAVSFEANRGRVMLGVEVDPDDTHSSVVAAARADDGRTVKLGMLWDGDGAAALARALPGLVKESRAAAVGWFPDGPARQLESTMRRLRCHVETIAPTEACPALASAIHAGDIRHSGDDTLTAHITSANKLPRSDGWQFARRSASPVDAAYAAAAAYVVVERILPRRRAA